MKSIAAQLAESLIATVGKPIDSTVMHAAERLVLDTLACGLGGVNMPAPIATRKWARRINGGGEATLIGARDRSSVLGATVANCTAMRDLDMNDTYYPRDSAHPSDNIGAILAVAEGESLSGEEVLRGVLVAYEVAMRTCEIAKKSFQRIAGWDHTTFVTVASAAGAGVLLGLDAQRLAHAISIAACYPTTGELRVGQISEMKAVSAGLGASRGIEAAYLAMDGVTGPAHAFEGRRGVSKLMIGEADWEILSAPVTEWRLPRSNLKRYPAAYIQHSSIDSALALRRETGLSPDDIEEVRVDAFSWLVEDMVEGMGGISRYEIDSRETADHSLPYVVAVSLVDGDYNLKQLENKRWEAPEVRAMIAKTKCFRDPEMDKVFPGDRPGRVTVKMKNGAVHVKELAYPRGDYREPFTDEELCQKFHSLAERVLDKSKRDKVIDLALNLRKSDAKTLMRACTGAGD